VWALLVVVRAELVELALQLHERARRWSGAQPTLLGLMEPAAAAMASGEGCRCSRSAGARWDRGVWLAARRGQRQGAGGLCGVIARGAQDCVDRALDVIACR
jgi:hypothetical protein